MEDCIFCQIIKGKSKATVFFEDEHCLAFKPLDVASEGHLLVVPKKHSKDIFDIDEDILKSLMLTTKEIASKVKKKYGATGVTLLNASGKGAHQSVFHFHIHLVPRYPNDGLRLWFNQQL